MPAQLGLRGIRGAVSIMKPSFVGIGAQKCASTWLYRILIEHPEVGIADVKEVDFFSYHFDHGYEWYEKKFHTNAATKAFGEISPSYFCDLSAAERIHAYNPDARILLTLRDPVKRALSNHRHEVRVGHLTGSDLSFERGLANNPMYVEQGLFAKHLKRWMQRFPAEQFMVILMDDIKADPAKVAAETYKFIGVADTYQPAGQNEQYNRSYVNRSQGASRAKDAIYNATRHPALRWAWSAAAAMGLRKLYRGVNTIESAQAIPDPLPETLDNLRAIFEPEIRELESLLNRKLDSWL